METLNMAIVGGGTGCAAFMDKLATEDLSGLPLNLVGVADINPEAPGIKRANELNIFTTHDYHDLFALDNLTLILELTGDPEITEAIHREKPKHIKFMDHTIAGLFWDLVYLVIDLSLIHISEPTRPY